MSIQAVAWAIKARVGSPTLKVLLMTIANYADEDGMCWPSQTRLAFDTEMSERSVRGGLSELEALGLIRREKRDPRNDGTRQTDLIYLVHRQNLPEATTGKLRQEPPANYVENHRQDLPVNHHKNHQENRHILSAPDEPTVDEETMAYFEEAWNEYPNGKNSSKKKALSAYRNNIRKRDRVSFFQAIVSYAEWLSEQRKKRPDFPAKHLSSFINEEVWKNYVPQQEAAE